MDKNREIPLQVPSTLYSYGSYLEYLKIIFHVDHENYSPEQLTKFISNRGERGWLLFMPSLNDKDMVEAEEIAHLPPLPKRDKHVRSPSENLHKKIFKLYKTQERLGMNIPESANVFYEEYMAKLAKAIDQKCIELKSQYINHESNNY